MFKVTTDTHKKTYAVVSIEGDLDALTSDRLNNTLSDLLQKGQIRLALDFRKVRFVSSAGLGAILRIQQEASKSGGQVRLFSLPKNVRNVFEIAGFDKIIPMVDQLEDAVEGW